MNTIDSKIWREARRALERAVALHLDDPNVSHIDLGFRIRSSGGNCIEPELTVRIHVHQKLSGDSFRAFAARQPRRVFDAERIGFAIDVPQATYRLHWWEQPWETPNQRAQLHRELRGGISISNAASFGFGTLGGKVRDRQNGEEMILSNWHVLAGSWLAKPGLSICQPAIGDGGATANAVAAYTRHAMDFNLDAAVAKLNGQRPLLNEQMEIGVVTGASVPQLGMKVIKSGRRSGVTSGIVTGVEGCTKQYYAGITRIIRNIIHIAPEAAGQEISAPGDSGAWWLEKSTLRAVGLHFAGSNHPEFGLALSMPEVLDALNVEIAPCNATSIHTSHRKNCNMPQAIPMATKAHLQKVSGLISKNTEASQCKAAFSISSPRLPARAVYEIMQVYLLVVLCMTAIGCCFHLRSLHRRQNEKINRLQNYISDLTALAQVDSSRRANICKVIAMIDRLNPQMNSELKFRIAAEIDEMSRKYRNLDVELVCATITHETGHTWNPEAVSPAGAMGLMQIMPATGLHLAQEDGLPWSSAEDILFDPIHNIRLGCRYLSGLVEAYNLDGGLAAYNGGEQNAKLWLRRGRAQGILPQETAFYVPSVLRIYQEYLRANEK